MKKELREIENYDLKILQEKAKDGSMIVYAKFSEAEKRNQNSRIYPLEILSREVNRVQTKINAGQFLGQSDHSDSPATFLKDVSHVVTKLEMIGNNGYATIRILNTDAGKNVQEIIRGKGKIGISTRSVGTISATGIVQKDLRLLALDLVANPSVADATIGEENILEGIEFKEESDAEKDLEKSISALEKSSFLGAVESGFKGTEEEFSAEYGGKLREMVGLPNTSDNLNAVEKLTEEQISARTYSYYNEAVQGGFIGSFSEWKDKFPQIVEQAKEKKVVVEKKEEPKAPFKSKATWNEIVQSGFRGTKAEYQEKFPDISIIELEAPKKVVAEKALTEKTLKEEAGRIFTGLMKDNPNSCITLESVIRMLEKEEEKKVDIRIRRKAIAIVNHDVFNSGGGVSQEILEKMVAEEIKRLQEERKLRREKNWECYRRLLD